MRKTSLWLFLALVIIINFTACSSSQPSPPWKAPIIAYETPAINVKVNEEFIVEYKQTGNLFITVEESHDNNVLSLIDSKSMGYDNNEGSITWFLYKAIKSGKTGIYIKSYTHMAKELIDQIYYQVIVN